MAQPSAEGRQPAAVEAVPKAFYTESVPLEQLSPSADDKTVHPWISKILDIRVEKSLQ